MFWYWPPSRSNWTSRVQVLLEGGPCGPLWNTLMTKKTLSGAPMTDFLDPCMVILSTQKHMFKSMGKKIVNFRDGSRISWKGVHIYKRVGISFADFISFFLKIPFEWNILATLRPNYFIFKGYLKTGVGRGSSEPPNALERLLDPPLNFHTQKVCLWINCKNNNSSNKWIHFEL